MRLFQPWRLITIHRAQMLRSLLASCRKRYLSAVVALAIAVACWFGPLLAPPPAHAVGNDALPNSGVLVTKVSTEPRETKVTLKLQGQADVSDHQTLLTTNGGDVAALEEVEAEDIAEDATLSSQSQSTVHSGGAAATQPSEMEDAVVATPVKQKSNTARKRAVGVAVAATAGGGAFAVTKRRIKNDESALEEMDASHSERIEQPKPKVAPVRTSQSLPLCDREHLKAREQPKSPVEESELATKYAQIDDVGERSFQILIDLVMIELHG